VLSLHSIKGMGLELSAETFNAH